MRGLVPYASHGKWGLYVCESVGSDYYMRAYSGGLARARFPGNARRAVVEPVSDLTWSGVCLAVGVVHSPWPGRGLDPVVESPAVGATLVFVVAALWPPCGAWACEV